MGKYFKQKINRNDYIPINIIASKIQNELVRPPKPTIIELRTPEYVQDWIKVLG